MLWVWRTTEHGLPIDASGEYAGEEFIGPKRLGELLAENEDFGDCVARQLFRYGMGHLETEGEQIAIDGLEGASRCEFSIQNTFGRPRIE